MRKIFFYIIAVFIIGSLVSSCSEDQKTAQQKLKEENKAIENFISKNNLNVLQEYPTGGVFGEKDYYQTKQGLFIHVIDSGNGTRAQILKHEIQVRFDSILYFQKETLGLKPNAIDLPISFTYGSELNYGSIACSGWAYALNYVGEGAVVNLIIPSQLGTTSDQSNFRPSFYRNLKFTAFY